MTDLFNPTESHEVLRETIRSFAEDEVAPQALEHDRAEQFNVELFRRLGDLGLLGATAPEEFGGSGMDATASVIAHEELSAADPGFCLAYLAHSVLFVNNLVVNGNRAQKEKYLPPACRGDKIAGMCMSEPSSGTDVFGMKTVAERDGDGWVLNGRKMWITNGAVETGELGDLFLVYAKHEDRESRDVSLFIVEKEMEGFELGQKLEDKLGMRASTTAELTFDDCRVPDANVVGEPGGATKSMMRNLSIERLVLAAMSLGLARRSVEIMNDYASDRTSFDQPIREHGQIQRYISESYADYMAGRSYVYQVADQMTLDEFGHRLEADGTKLFCSTMGKEVADRAIQVLGGYGYVGEYDVERLWRDAKLLEIGGGTIEAHQKNMTRELEDVNKIV
jgi:isovaleryl-CoA dehydrogenase